MIAMARLLTKGLLGRLAPAQKRNFPSEYYRILVFIFRIPSSFSNSGWNAILLHRPFTQSRHDLFSHRLKRFDAE